MGICFLQKLIHAGCKLFFLLECLASFTLRNWGLKVLLNYNNGTSKLFRFAIVQMQHGFRAIVNSAKEVNFPRFLMSF